MDTGNRGRGEESLVLRQEREGICTLTMNRPDQYNALSDEMIDGLRNALDDVAADASVRVVVLAGRGKAFCAGHDLRQMQANKGESYYRELFARCGALMTTIMHQPQPVIARVHGVATAAGCQLVASCDLAVASDNARFAVSGINVGLFCSTPSVALARNIGRKRAMEMLLTGEFIGAQQAAREGLINRAVAADELDGEVERLARLICAKSPVAVRTGKSMFYHQLDMGVEEAYRLAGEAMTCNMMSEDVAEGIAAFLEKRPPVWKGR